MEIALCLVRTEYLCTISTHVLCTICTHVWQYVCTNCTEYSSVWTDVWWGQPAPVQTLGAAPVDLGLAVLLLRWKWSKIQSCFDLKYYRHTCVWWWTNLYSSLSVLNLNCVKVYNLAEFKVIIFILFLNAGKVWPIIMYRWKIEEFMADVWLLMKCWLKNGVFCSMVDW